MAVTYFGELHSSRAVTYGAQDGSVTRKWVLIGTQDEAEVYAYVVVNTDEYWDGFIRNNIEFEPQGGLIWHVTVTYGITGQGGGESPVGSEVPTEVSVPADDESLGAGWQFDTGGGTVHITQSITTISGTRRGGGVATDFKNAIGVTKDSVEGCDIFTPGYEWSRTVARPVCTPAYIKTLAELTGTVNNDAWYHYDQGEVLFLGASGQRNDDGKWSITYKFSVRFNQGNIEVCDNLTVPSKLGHEYLWVLYAEEVQAGQVAPLPEAAYVEQVYEFKDFAALEIGV